jgi:hypothetical protein
LRDKLDPGVNMVAKSGFNVEVNVEVGSNSEHRQAVYIPAAARRVNPVLRRALSDRAIVTNTDATSLEAALQYIQQYRFLRRLQRNPLAKLATGSNMALNVAKAWHLAQMLELPRMQNKLIDTFSSCFRLLLEAPTHTPFSPEPFEYLRTHTGYYTNCEKFIVEFYAGLASHREPLCPKDLASLPGDIAQELQHRCTEMVASSTPYTRIEQGSKIYGVSSADRTWKAALHVVHPPALPSQAGTSTPPVSAVSPTTNPLAQSSKIKRRSFFSLPIFQVLLRKASSQPVIEDSPKSPQNTLRHTRHPFWPDPPRHRQGRVDMEVEESFEHDDSEFDLFSSILPSRNDSQQRVKRKSVKWAL